MDSRLIRKISNKVIFGSIIILFYWLFIFTVITVFDLKIFRERLTELFFISIFGIISLIASSFMVNILANLTIIADASIGGKKQSEKKSISKIKLISFVLSFPIIIILLFTGNSLTVNRKQSILNNTAKKLAIQYKDDLDFIGNFNFTRTYLEKSEDLLKTISSIDNNFPTINAIHRIHYNNKQIFICIKNAMYINPNEKLKITDFIYTSSESERDYMNTILDSKKEKKPFFESRKGNYKLIIPIKSQNNKMFFLLLTDYQQYGKIGS